VLRSAVVLVVAAACASGTSTAWETPARRGPVYKPGQSIAESRICACRECVDRGCCSGERESAEEAEAELGMTLAACGRCTRRVWTVRGAESCASLAGPECCPGTVSD
jgi:hypothetical protein